MPPKDVERMANSVDPDQTAPQESSLIRIYTVCSDIYVLIFRIFTGSKRNKPARNDSFQNNLRFSQRLIQKRRSIWYYTDKDNIFLWTELASVVQEPTFKIGVA